MTASMRSLLQRAKATEFAGGWPAGANVVRELAAVPPLRGRVAFVGEDGWVYWAAEDGCVHASRPDVLRRLP